MSKEHQHDVVTVGRLRVYVVFAFTFLFLLLTALNVVSVNDDRHGCEVANNARVGELHQRETLVTVNVGRVLAAEVPAEREANRVALELYRDNLVELVDSQRLVALNPNVEIPARPDLLATVTPEHPFDVDTDAVVADCSVTNPYPPPVSWFD